MPGVLAPP